MWILLSAGQTGCWIFSSEPPPVVPIQIKSYDELPDEPGELFLFAGERNRPGATIPELSTAISAYEKLLRQMEQGEGQVDSIVVSAQDAPQGTLVEISEMEVKWRMAMAFFLAGECAREASEKIRWIARGEEIADEIIEGYPERVEGYYFGALLKGRRAENSGLGFSALKLAQKVEEMGLQAAKMNPAFEDGGPYRLLAMLYAKAPPWPTSLGDMDKALDYADQAVGISDYPMNHLIRAEVLIEDDEMAEARSELKLVLAAPKVGRWALEGEQWRPYAMKLLAKIENK